MTQSSAISFLSFLILFCFYSFVGLAQVDQDGWSLIDQNQFVLAKEQFTAQLEEQPADQDARLGLIFLAETEQDYLGYKREITALIDQDWDSVHMATLGHMYGDDMAPGVIWGG